MHSELMLLSPTTHIVPSWPDYTHAAWAKLSTATCAKPLCCGFEEASKCIPSWGEDSITVPAALKEEHVV